MSAMRAVSGEKRAALPDLGMNLMGDSCIIAEKRHYTGRDSERH